MRDQGHTLREVPLGIDEIFVQHGGAAFTLPVRRRRGRQRACRRYGDRLALVFHGLRSRCFLDRFGGPIDENDLSARGLAKPRPSQGVACAKQACIRGLNARPDRGITDRFLCGEVPAGTGRALFGRSEGVVP